MPLWLLSIVLVFGSYRLTRLITKDDFPPVLWARDRLAGGWRPLTEREWSQFREEGHTEFKTTTLDGETNRWVQRASWSPYWLADLVTCPWCASAYVSLGLVGGTALWVGLPVPLLMWLGVWAASAVLASQEWA